MIFYYYTCQKYGIENLKHRRLKISDFTNVNDPFELMGIDLRDRDIRNTINLQNTEIASQKGLLCFSEDKYNPVQWAHYADNHRGICLGFEIPENALKKVSYVVERLPHDVIEHSDCSERLLTTKFKHWEYEKERRLVLDLSDHPRNTYGLRFKKFDEHMVLREIYIGCRSHLTFDDISKAFSSGNGRVIVRYTRPSFKDFRIVWAQHKKSLRI